MCIVPTWLLILLNIACHVESLIISTAMFFMAILLIIMVPI